MASFREIVTKAVIGKGKKVFSNKYMLKVQEMPSTILGCWVINHKFKGTKAGDKILVEGTCDVNIWYSYDNDTKTIVSNETITYSELVNVARRKETNINGNEDIIIRSLRQPSSTRVEIIDGNIVYDIEKELGIEIVGDVKVRVTVDDDEDEWDEIIDENEEEKIINDIETEVKEKFIND